MGLFPLLLVPLPFFLCLLSLSKAKYPLILSLVSFSVLLLQPTEYHQVTHPNSRERVEISFEFRKPQLLLAGMARPNVALRIGKHLS